jgi:hypothetical protein
MTAKLIQSVRLINLLRTCSETAKLDRFWVEFSAVIPWLGGAESDEGIEISDAQKAFILKQGADGMPVADLCRKSRQIAAFVSLRPRYHECGFSLALLPSRYAAHKL